LFDIKRDRRSTSTKNRNEGQSERKNESQNKNQTVHCWLKSWRARINLQTTSNSTRIEKMKRVNPAVIPRNHQVEAAIRAAEDHNDFDKFNELNKILKAPFESNKENESYRQPPKDYEKVQRTFCGT